MSLKSQKYRACYSKLIDVECDDNIRNAEATKSTGAIIMKILRFSKHDWMLLTVGIVFLVASCIGESMVPFYTGKVLDSILQHSSHEVFMQFASLLFGISVLSSLSQSLQGYCLFIANRKLNIRIRNALFASIMKQEIAFFEKGHTGDILSRLTTDTTVMLTDMQFNVMKFLQNAVKIATAIVFMLQLSWRLLVVSLAGLPLLVIVSHLYGRYLKNIIRCVHNSLADANCVAAESISTIQTVRSFANEEEEVKRYATQLETSYKLYRQQGIAFAGYIGFNQFIKLILSFSVLLYGRYIFEDGTLTGGIFLAFALYQIKLGTYINSMGTVCSGLFEGVGSADKIFEYIDRMPQIDQRGYLCPKSLTGSVKFENVYFSYPSRPYEQVLKGISFKVNPGEIVALVGPNGGGKTSCFNLIEGFYKPQSGRVLLDGESIQLYEHKFLHKQVSLVHQEPDLYARSIAENIRYGLKDDEWTTHSIEEASRLANVHDVISQLHDGYKTQAGEKGLHLSGGQKQRIAIARSLVRNPKVLLLDEATSALDTESEKLIQDTVYKRSMARTVLIIAHRLSTVERADKILVLENGYLVEEGTHQQLLTRLDGVYASLVNQQVLSN